jgi:hypothetical protein
MQYSQQARDIGFRFNQLHAQLELYEETRWPEDKERALTMAGDIQERLAALTHELEKEPTHGQSPPRQPQ